MERDSKGRFVPGNTISKCGGAARAQKLSKRRRRQIAKMGWRAYVTKHFGGNEWIAKRYKRVQRAYATDVYRGTWMEYPNPGTEAEWLERQRQIHEATVGAEVDFGWRSGGTHDAD